MIMKDNNEISNIFIVADGVVVEAGDELPWALIMLMLCYGISIRNITRSWDFCKHMSLKIGKAPSLCQETILNSFRRPGV